MKRRTADKRIERLSYTSFEEEFGFRPHDKLEQNWFAFKGCRLDPRMRRMMERHAELKERRDAES